MLAFDLKCFEKASFIQNIGGSDHILGPGTVALILESDSQLTAAGVYARVLGSMSLISEEIQSNDAQDSEEDPIGVLNVGSSSSAPYLCKVCDSYLQMLEDINHYSVMEALFQVSRIVFTFITKMCSVDTKEESKCIQHLRH